MAKKTTRKTTDNFNFEAALAELEQLVESMEQGELTLEQSLQDFERGIELTRACQQALKQADQKVQILVEKSSGAKLSAFTAGQED